MTRTCIDCDRPLRRKTAGQGRFPKRCATCKRKWETAYGQAWRLAHPSYFRDRRALKKDAPTPQKNFDNA